MKRPWNSTSLTLRNSEETLGPVPLGETEKLGRVPFEEKEKLGRVPLEGTLAGQGSRARQSVDGRRNGR